MSDTPRTNANIVDFGYRDEGGTWVQQHGLQVEFGRIQERELTALQSELAAERIKREAAERRLAEAQRRLRVACGVDNR